MWLLQYITTYNKRTDIDLNNIHCTNIPDVTYGLNWPPIRSIRHDSTSRPMSDTWANTAVHYTTIITSAITVSETDAKTWGFAETLCPWNLDLTYHDWRFHGLYGSTSCCISQWPSQCGWANFDPPQLRNRLTDFDEIRNLEPPPEDHPPCKISFRSDNVGGFGE